MKTTLREWCEGAGNVALLREWDVAANGDFTPDSVTAGSHRRILWRCDKGHTWEAAIFRRTYNGTGCPYCAGTLPIVGETDFATKCPEAAAEWDYEKNDGLTPRDVMPGSNKNVWWRCSMGHRFRASVRSRGSGGTGCPYCAGQKVLKGFNDLATRYPQLAAEWHPTFNGDLKPEDVTPGCNKKVWWVCLKRHTWLARIDSRTGRDKCACPVCAGQVKRAKLAGYDRVAQRPLRYAEGERRTAL